MTEIRVPTLGESVTEATIGKWFKKPGDTVVVDDQNKCRGVLDAPPSRGMTYEFLSATAIP